MTKNNKVECWKPKDCGKNFGKSSSKCGECITLQLELLDDWEPNTDDGSPNAIAILNFEKIEDFFKPTPYNKFLSIANIPESAKKNNIFSVDICKSNIINNNNTLYYLIADKYFEVRGEIGIPFTVSTSKCVNLIPINNACPKSICQTTTITFVLTGDNDNYSFSGDTEYTSSKKNNCIDYDEAAASFVKESNILTLTYVVDKSIIVNSLTVRIGTDIYYYKYPSGLIIDLTQISSQNCSLTIDLALTDFQIDPL
jgi:hypothetical protein